MSETLQREVDTTLDDFEGYITSGLHESRVCIIDKTAAEKILDKWNSRNRPIRESKVKKYAEEMSRGRWKFNGVPLIFSPLRLLDGQHRLEAVVVSGQPLETMVVFGTQDDAFDTIDAVGSARTAADIFSINGVPNPALISAATKAVWSMRNFRALSQGGGDGSRRINYAELYEEYKRHPDLQKSVWVGANFTQTKLAMPSLMTALHYMCSLKSKAEADTFFHKISTGLGFDGEEDPAYVLYKRLVLDAGSSKAKLQRNAIADITIKAWNAARSGTKLKRLHYARKKGTKLPKIK